MGKSSGKAKKEKLKDKAPKDPKGHGKRAKASEGTPRLMERYRKEILPALSKRFNRSNALSLPRVTKIVVNIGCGEAAQDAKFLESVRHDLGAITGQRPLVTRAKQAISNFKIKQGDPVGCKVTLRRARMYEFFDRLVNVALPRIRDFQGLSLKGFDRGGNYNFGIEEHTIFPEMELDRVRAAIGMDISIVTSTQSREEAIELLSAFGVPFMRSKKSSEQGQPVQAASSGETV